MGEGGRALGLIREAADALLAEAESLGDEERVEFRRQLNRYELAFSLSTRRLLDECCEDLDLSPVQVLRHDCMMASS